MLRQKAQFIEAQHGVATSRSFLSIDASNPSELESWEVEGPRVEKTSSSDPRVRLNSLTAWFRGSLLSRRGFMIMGCVLGVCIAGVAAARYLIPVEVAHYEVGCDGDWFEASLHVKRGSLFAECHDAQWLRNADGSWRRDELVKEVQIGSSRSIMMGKPSIQFDMNGYRLTFHADNRIVAQYDCWARQFQVYE